jgi:acetoin utilization deacetylase AcuC-like enzyme
MKIKVIYSVKGVAESGSKISPSAIKPKLLVEYLQTSPFKDIIEFVEPVALTREDFLRCHTEQFVDDILHLRKKNGFGTISQSVVDSLPWTNGTMYLATKLALEQRTPTCAMCSGFHHAGYEGYEGLGYFCTFNGLTIAAMKIVEEGKNTRVTIVDCDMHWGNGTDDILKVIDPHGEKCRNISFGMLFHNPYEAKKYLAYFDKVRIQLEEFKPNVIIYQSGADVHVDDPFGGVLTEAEMYERDLRMFRLAKELGIPITWTLAGGYQLDKDGGCSYVLKLHENTFKACQEVYNL